MRFNPHMKIVRDEQAELAADFELPDDLELLGQQLGDDAAHLASLFPASPFATSPLTVALSQASFNPSLKPTAQVTLASDTAKTVIISSRPARSWRWLGGLATIATGLAVLVMASPWLVGHPGGSTNDVATDSSGNSSALATKAPANLAGSATSARKSDAASLAVASPADQHLAETHPSTNHPGTNHPDIVGLPASAPSGSADPSAFMNSVLLKNVTGPELEGVLDLLEHDTPDQPGVSLEL